MKILNVTLSPIFCDTNWAKRLPITLSKCISLTRYYLPWIQNWGISYYFFIILMAFFMQNIRKPNENVFFLFLFLILWDWTRPKFYPSDSTQFRFFANFRQNMSRNSIMSITSNAVAMKKKNIVKMILLGSYLDKKQDQPKIKFIIFFVETTKRYQLTTFLSF